MNFKRMVIATLVLILTACSQPAEIAPTSSASVSTVGSASTELSQSATEAPTKKIGTPVPGWEDIPIMPGAYEPELADMVYLYTVDIPIDQVEEYYQAKMEVNGWTLTNRQELDSGPTGGPSTVLDYQKSDQLLNIMLVNLVEKNATSVILSQLSP
jgi:activator of HSP90 ATPase